MSRMRLARNAAALAGVAVLAMTASAPAAKPTIERIVINEEFADVFLTQACGVPVRTTATGRVTIRTFGEGSPNAEVSTANIRLVATGPGGSYRFRDVGANRVRIEENGDVILTLTGQLPFQFTGRLVINLTTGEVLRTPQPSTADRLDDACAALS